MISIDTILIRPNGQFSHISNISNIIIRDGVLGLSAHQAIHSNEASNILISNLYVIHIYVHAWMLYICTDGYMVLYLNIYA